MNPRENLFLDDDLLLSNNDYLELHSPHTEIFDFPEISTSNIVNDYFDEEINNGFDNLQFSFPIPVGNEVPPKITYNSDELAISQQNLFPKTVGITVDQERNNLKESVDVSSLQFTKIENVSNHFKNTVFTDKETNNDIQIKTNMLSTPHIDKRLNKSPQSPPGIDVIESNVINAMDIENVQQIDSKSFSMTNCSAYIIRPINENDVGSAFRHKKWSSTEVGNKILDEAFLNRQGEIFLIFCVVSSNNICAIAKMTSKVDFEVNLEIFSKKYWKGGFDIEFIHITDISSDNFDNFRIEARDDDFNHLRDCDKLNDIEFNDFLKIYSRSEKKTTLLDDLSFYESTKTFFIRGPRFGANSKEFFRHNKYNNRNNRTYHNKKQNGSNNYKKRNKYNNNIGDQRRKSTDKKNRNNKSSNENVW
eukprot:TRINITY_DN1327_c0_g1_i1.p1 TRINITY_DN1327_c0_g1~~TRINITY_DN1327_c0_g1_i1.p1  ORF type:complete len:419 (-),score=107.49 TRINITY_DN1327_c0_g1_i1:149-1405(-)